MLIDIINCIIAESDQHLQGPDYNVQHDENNKRRDTKATWESHHIKGECVFKIYI